MLLPHRTWPELVMHVLAHVSATAGLPASLYDPVYVGWVAARLGPASERELGEDAVALGRVLVGHEQLARVQLLAWLFDDAERAAAVAERDIGVLITQDVDRPELLAPLVELGPAVELLRCAAELEREALSALGPPAMSMYGSSNELLAALDRVQPVAPSLAHSSILCLRSLRLRGRVRGDEIWIGAPESELDLGAAHVAWQAAHEATVREVGQAAALAERRVEAVALVLLAERARRAERSAEHLAWLGHLAGPPPIDPTSLGDREGELYRRLLATGA